MKTVTITVWDDTFGSREWVLESTEKEELRKALEAIKDTDSTDVVKDLLKLLK